MILSLHPAIFNKGDFTCADKIGRSKVQVQVLSLSLLYIDCQCQVILFQIHPGKYFWVAWAEGAGSLSPCTAIQDGKLPLLFQPWEKGQRDCGNVLFLLSLFKQVWFIYIWKWSFLFGWSCKYFPKLKPLTCVMLIFRLLQNY